MSKTAIAHQIAKRLRVEPDEIQPLGGSQGASLFKQVQADGQRVAFIKVGDPVLTEGEAASLDAISSIVPGICPEKFESGVLENGLGFYSAEFLEFGGSPKQSLAPRLAQLHSTPAPSNKFGFPVTTCCGSTQQPNDFEESWATFFAKHRMLAILDECKRIHGPDARLEKTIKDAVKYVVPRLLGQLEIQPVVLHGDLWAGNTSPVIRNGKSEHIVFDCGSIYGHSEYDLGDMRMFGGFNRQFMREYHSIVAKTAPEEEYDDRISLYESYHHFNHHALGMSAYKSTGLQLLDSLLTKYRD